MTDQELTRLAAERVMGWSAFSLSEPGYNEAPYPKLIKNVLSEWMLHENDRRWRKFNPLTDWRAAGEIVERMRELGWRFDLGVGLVLVLTSCKVIDRKVSGSHCLNCRRMPGGTRIRKSPVHFSATWRRGKLRTLR